MIFCRPVVLDCISVALLGSIVAQRLAVSPQSKRVQRFASTVFVRFTHQQKHVCQVNYFIKTEGDCSIQGKKTQSGPG